MGGERIENRGIYHGDREWREETEFTWFPAQPFESKAWRSSLSSESSEFRLTHKVVERVIETPDFSSDWPTASAVYVADRYSGGTITEERVIVKVFMRIPYLDIQEGNQYVHKQQLLSLKLPIAEEFPDHIPRKFEKELGLLEYLQQHEFAYAPSLITSFKHHKANPWVQDGFLGFVVMQKLSAVTISDIWKHKPQSETQLKEQRRIQEAFKVSFTEMENLGVGMLDCGARNLMWDSKSGKCYFIDFEDAGIGKPPKNKQTWESLASHWSSPLSEFSNWGIIMEEQYSQFDKDIEESMQRYNCSFNGFVLDSLHSQKEL